MTKSNIERKGFIFVYSSRERVCNDKGGMDVSNRIRKLTDHISMYTQEAEKDNSRGRETYKPLKSSPSALLPLKWLHLQRFHSLPKEFHQVGTICSNTRAHDIIFKYKSPWYNISHLYHNTSTYLALYFKRFFLPNLLIIKKQIWKKEGRETAIPVNCRHSFSGEI